MMTAAPPAAGKTVLVVDDDDVIQSVLKKSLEKLGFKVIQASGGHEAQNKIKKSNSTDG